MTKLSPAAQAVLNALTDNWRADPYEMDVQAFAAALHEVARQVVPDDIELSKRSGEAVRLNRLSICRQIHAIADELETQ